ncbi:hypothetical protein PGT21_026109 [Puccinia graminis f. sp. tritici]|uniref:PSMD12/CSN4-like N-terminal domain-containing protein n=1 Tax=Puccinia graminis f. sp. tritici TaxID=56615 RepID=A0A5B0NTD4_PUCGR|nr:hypothetical protein PGT21_026109 [Puccinia graminis f. sp. tritici]
MIESLREVTEGKIYLEVQRARLTKQLAQIRESEGATKVANELMQELQVETFGSMERREKIDFILEQMRLLRIQQDWEKLAIVSKKINNKWLTEVENEDLKLRYYRLMITYASKQSNTSTYVNIIDRYMTPNRSDQTRSDLLHRIAKEEEELKKIEAV